jgi:hypothetical protein
MRFMIWNGDRQVYECNLCEWKQAILASRSDPAECLERDFSLHQCEEHRRKAAA